jgi:two-component system response regulator YesN
MYRVLVVDDESFITDSLAFMLESQRSMELEVVKAYSAPEAMEMLNRAAFHIVVTDVEMPGQSGLDLLREIHIKWPSCQVVFLTGHDSFQYAQEAIRYNVVRYVLKTEGDEILLEAIAECIRRIKNEQADTAYLNTGALNDEAAEKRNRTREHALLRDSLLSLHIESRQAADSLASQWRDAKLCLNPYKRVMLMAGCTQNKINNDTLDALGAIVTAKIGHAVLSETMLINEKLCLWIMQSADKSNRTHALAAVKGMAEGIQETIRISLSVKITFVLDEEEILWSDVPKRLASLEDIARSHLDKHKGLALAGARFFEKPPGENDYAVSGTAFVSYVQNHIRENLGGDLSLTALSELVYLNASYLSRRFKEITGKNLTDTILEVRMEEACRLLKNTAGRVKNIAAELGYESAAHFSRIFKREMGVTPQEYRDKQK